MTASVLAPPAAGAAVAAAARAGAAELCDTAEGAGWRGPDPYDGLWFCWPRPVVGGRRRRQAVAQLHARSPVDFRPLYRRGHPLLPKAVGTFASARVRLHAQTGDGRHRDGALAALAVLDAQREAGPDAWGYPFDVQTRWSFYPAGAPNVVVTAFAAAGLADGAEAFGEERYAERARRAARWVFDRLFLADLGIYAYHPDSRTSIHNASLLGARVTHRLIGDDAAVAEANARAVERTLAGQQADGSFPYGEGPGLGFVDSFHTGYVLDCLCDFAALDPRVPEAIERGARFWAERFFGPRGDARLWARKPYPEDAHAAGTAMTTFAALDRVGLGHPELLVRVTRRATTHMLRGAHALHRRYRWGPTRVQYLRWADSHMALGLAHAAATLGAPSRR